MMQRNDSRAGLSDGRSGDVRARGGLSGWRDRQRDEARALAAGAAVLALTVGHHVYGAIHYATPERYHAVVIAMAALGVILGGFALSRRWPGARVRRGGWWVFWGGSALVPVLLFGVVEGFYNHVLKVALYLGGLREESLRRLYPAPTYELPNDLIFELTGVLQVVPAVLAGYFLVRLLLARLATRSARRGALDGSRSLVQRRLIGTGRKKEEHPRHHQDLMDRHPVPNAPYLPGHMDDEEP